MSETTANNREFNPLHNRLIAILLAIVSAVVALIVLGMILVVLLVSKQGPMQSADTHAGAGFVAGPTAALAVHFTPNPPRVHSPLAVRVSGLHAGEGLRIVFSRIPRTDAFGGPIGTFYANARGTLHFIYPAFVFKQERGPWKMVAYRSNGMIALIKTFRVAG